MNRIYNKYDDKEVRTIVAYANPLEDEYIYSDPECTKKISKQNLIEMFIVGIMINDGQGLYKATGINIGANDATVSFVKDNLDEVELVILHSDIEDELPTPSTYKLTFVAVEGGESLTGATITVYSDSEKTQVVSDLNNLLPGTYYYTVSKENFETIEDSVTIVNADVEVEIDLQEDI